MTRELDPNLRTGHDKIDHQHDELFQLIEMLDGALLSNSMNDLLEIIVFLEHYVVEHFGEEEALMKQNDFSGYDHHRSEHQKFTLMVKEIRETFDQGINKAHLVFGIRQFIDALVEHVKTVDILISGLVEEAHGQ
jgi:hemerythrin